MRQQQQIILALLHFQKFSQLSRLFQCFPQNPLQEIPCLFPKHSRKPFFMPITVIKRTIRS